MNLQIFDFAIDAAGCMVWKHNYIHQFHETIQLNCVWNFLKCTILKDILCISIRTLTYMLPRIQLTISHHWFSDCMAPFMNAPYLIALNGGQPRCDILWSGHVIGYWLLTITVMLHERHGISNPRQIQTVYSAAFSGSSQTKHTSFGFLVQRVSYSESVSMW